MERLTIAETERLAREELQAGRLERAFVLMIVADRARAEMARARKGKGVKVGH